MKTKVESIMTLINLLHLVLGFWLAGLFGLGLGPVIGWSIALDIFVGSLGAIAASLFIFGFISLFIGEKDKNE